MVDDAVSCAVQMVPHPRTVEIVFAKFACQPSYPIFVVDPFSAFAARRAGGIGDGAVIRNCNRRPRCNRRRRCRRS